MLDPDFTDLGLPTTAYRDQMDTAKLVLLEVTARRGDAVPGLTEYLQDSVHIDSGDVGRRQAHGWFYPGAWKHEGHDIDEIFLNADRGHGVVGKCHHQAVFLLIELLQLPLQGGVAFFDTGGFVGQRFIQQAAKLTHEVARQGKGLVVLDDRLLDQFDS